jgi:L-fuculose-phosphate aldolase
MSMHGTEVRAAREAIVAGYRALDSSGLMHGSAGNVSARVGDTMLITPSGIDTARLTAEGLVAMSLDGRVQGAGLPSSEWRMHAGVYLRHPQAQAIVHTHADACVALACLRRDLPAFHYMVAGFGGDDVRCAAYAPFGSQRLAGLAADALEARTACLLANHGMLARGATVMAAVAATRRLETLCRQYLLALQAGEPVLLDADELREVHGRYAHYGCGPMPG